MLTAVHQVTSDANGSLTESLPVLRQVFACSFGKLDEISMLANMLNQ